MQRKKSKKGEEQIENYYSVVTTISYQYFRDIDISDKSKQMKIIVCGVYNNRNTLFNFKKNRKIHDSLLMQKQLY